MTWLMLCQDYAVILLLVAFFAGAWLGTLLATAFRYVDNVHGASKIADEIRKLADRVDRDGGPERVLADSALGGVLKRNVRSIIKALERA